MSSIISSLQINKKITGTTTGSIRKILFSSALFLVLSLGAQTRPEKDWYTLYSVKDTAMASI